MIKTERLSRLATLLEESAAAKLNLEFNLRDWSNTETREETVRTGFLGLFKETREVRCNTAACAVGLACLSGEFKNDGLDFTQYSNNISPIYLNKTNWGAVEKFFGLSRSQATKLFDSRAYDGPIYGRDAELEVAERIRALVDKSKAASKAKAKKAAATKAKRVSSSRITSRAITKAVDNIKRKALESV